MLRGCALDYGSSWDENFPYVEFSYNNIHQASIEMAPFEALYGRKCTTPLLWSGVGERSLFGADIIKYAKEKVRLIRDRLKIAQSRQKTTHTYLLANPNLEGEIHIKGVRLVTSQNLNNSKCMHAFISS
jgi:hypothetical protein